MEAMKIVRGSARRRGANQYQLNQLEQMIIKLESRVAALEEKKSSSKPRPKKEE